MFPGVPNRSSNQVQVLAGLSTDLSELLRGSIGIGYINRTYDAARYRTVAGLSFNGKVEYFPSQLTTVTLSGRREVDDASLIGTSGFFATNAALRIDHELLRNLLVNLGADLEFDDYRDFSGRATSFRTSAGGQYLVNHQLSFNGQLFYGRRTTNSPWRGRNCPRSRRW
ncbi:outer membrane beta-barrel protein [Sphingomonas sp. I4]